MPEETTVTTAAETNTAATQTPTATPTPTPAATAAEAPKPGVYLTPEQYADIQGRLQTLDGKLAEESRKAREAEERAIESARKEGDTNKLLERLTAREKAEIDRLAKEKSDDLARIGREREAERTRLTGELAAADNRAQATEARAKRYALDGELARALSSHDLVPHAAEDLMSLWKSRFTVEPHGESFAVKSDDGRSVADFVAAQLGSDRYGHYVKAKTRQGGTALSGAVTTTTPSPTPSGEGAPQPRTMGEAVILHMQAQQKAQGDARSDMNLPIGLRAIR